MINYNEAKENSGNNKEFQEEFLEVEKVVDKSIKKAYLKGAKGCCIPLACVSDKTLLNIVYYYKVEGYEVEVFDIGYIGKGIKIVWG